MLDFFSKLTRNQQNGLLALLCSKNIEDAAKRAGVSRMTIHRWLKDPIFMKEFRRQKEQLFLDATLHLQRSSLEAADLLVNIARDTDLPAGSRVSACRVIIEMGLKGTEFDDVLKRIENVEANLTIRP
jgi:hypothetical protein